MNTERTNNPALILMARKNKILARLSKIKLESRLYERRMQVRL